MLTYERNTELLYILYQTNPLKLNQFCRQVSVLKVEFWCDRAFKTLSLYVNELIDELINTFLGILLPQSAKCTQIWWFRKCNTTNTSSMSKYQSILLIFLILLCMTLYYTLHLKLHLLIFFISTMGSNYCTRCYRCFSELWWWRPNTEIKLDSARFSVANVVLFLPRCAAPRWPEAGDCSFKWSKLNVDKDFLFCFFTFLKK